MNFHKTHWGIFLSPNMVISMHFKERYFVKKKQTHWQKQISILVVIMQNWGARGGRRLSKGITQVILSSLSNHPTTHSFHDRDQCDVNIFLKKNLPFWTSSLHFGSIIMKRQTNPSGVCMRSNWVLLDICAIPSTTWCSTNNARFLVLLCSQHKSWLD